MRDFAMKMLTLIVLCCAFVAHASAQYYERSYEQTENRFVHVGFWKKDFAARSSNSLPDSLRIGYDRILPTIGFRQGLLDITFGYARFSLRGEDKTTIVVTATIGNEFPLTFSPTQALLLPLMISSDYTRADNSGGDREAFNIGSVGFGAGLKYRIMSGAFEFALSASEVAHWSLEGFSTGSGFSPATLAEAQFVFREVAGLDGITLGYRFRYQSWNMNNDKYDYNSLSHGAYLGVMF
ncbi:MAG: hypothetical protein HY961_08610 [Ignavibacteriae bacterium]|nr:hypothetical protein [Ignavibacteriota bacterium]